MKSLLLFLLQKTFALIPDTRGFGYKRFCLKLAGVKVGKNVRICSSVRIIGDGKLSIGDDSWIGHDTKIICSDSIVIGKNVDIAPLCVLVTGTHAIAPEEDHVAGKGYGMPIIIEDGAWICAHSTILPGTTIGRKAIVAAGSVVKGIVAPFEIVGNSLASHLKNIIVEVNEK